MTRARLRLSIALLVLTVLPACAGMPDISNPCPAALSAVDAQEVEPTQSAAGCGMAAVENRLAAVGGVQQRGRQTRTVGVPRGFLIALIVLLVIFSAA